MFRHLKGVSSFSIRPVQAEDRDRIFEIRNEVIRSSPAILEDDPWPHERWVQWWNQKNEKLPFLSLIDGKNVVQGYAFLMYFGDRSGYRVTGEVSIHLDPSIRGKGQGKILLARLLEEGKRFGFHSVVSRITSDNEASVRLHERVGFVRGGHLPEVARKFDRYFDIYYYQRRFS